ncbi:MAG TPA: hypothetical protein VF490_17230, partial [Chryseosolibacter sp.]
MKTNILLFLSFALVVMLVAAWAPREADEQASAVQAPPDGRYLYVAVPGIRNYLGYGGHGILVFDIDNNHRFVKRIKTRGFKSTGEPSNVKGIAVSVPLNSI